MSLNPEREADGPEEGAVSAERLVAIRGATTIDFAATPYSVQYAGATANFGSDDPQGFIRVALTGCSGSRDCCGCQ